MAGAVVIGLSAGLVAVLFHQAMVWLIIQISAAKCPKCRKIYLHDMVRFGAFSDVSVRNAFFGPPPQTLCLSALQREKGAWVGWDSNPQPTP